MLLQQQLEKIMRKKKFSKLVSSCQYYCLLGTVHTTSSAGGFDYLQRVFIEKILFSVVSYATPINAKKLKKVALYIPFSISRGYKKCNAEGY